MINGIPANHLIWLAWHLTDSSPCQSAFRFATFGSLSLCSLSRSVSICLSVSLNCLFGQGLRVDQGASVLCLLGAPSDPSGPCALAAQSLRRSADVSLIPSPIFGECVCAVCFCFAGVFFPFFPSSPCLFCSV